MSLTTIAVAHEDDRQAIYKIRHLIYAQELGQHQQNEKGELTDNLDSFNVYVVAKKGNEIIGFVSLTPPTAPSFSVD
ncbi:MAG: hypothetical protein ICV51_21395 [Flavisolibacter sp.]|nr:hypothetical protein [Flavisolibacter sp.]